VVGVAVELLSHLTGVVVVVELVDLEQVLLMR
jgi:hypothetical protein